LVLNICKAATHEVSTLLLEPWLQFILLCFLLFWKWGLTNYLSRLASLPNLILPSS
jgi:hypothetical protein